MFEEKPVNIWVNFFTKKDGNGFGQMIYAFVQDGQNIGILRQQWESLSSYAESRSLSIDNWLDSTSFNPELFKAKDVLLLEKTFRLGKDIRTITAIMQELLQKGVVICLVSSQHYFSYANVSYECGLVARWRVYEDYES